MRIAAKLLLIVLAGCAFGYLLAAFLIRALAPMIHTLSQVNG